MITGCEACRVLTRIVEEDMRLAGLTINWKKLDGTPLQERIHLGFVVNFAEGLFKVPIRRWEALKASIGLIYPPKVLEFKHGNSQAWLAQLSP